MSISKKEFYALSSKLSAIRPYDPKSFYCEDPTQKNYNCGKWQGWADAVQSVADACAELNPKFNKEYFIEACND
jgi:hypothetical protein